ncbi:MAG TPA: GIY-YIG nuclease family protein [Pirellulales bacterium]|jgi:hypothetical protein|nr:GIY-YIG nuclease family protein [Pirellulales bacterium]
MDYIIVAILGIAGGWGCALIALAVQRAKLRAQKREQDLMAERISQSSHAIGTARQQIETESSRLEAARAQFDMRAVAYTELHDENAILKRDLRNLDVGVRKLQLDRDQQRQSQEALNQRANELGSRYLKESVKWISSSLNPNNFSGCKQRLIDVIVRCRGIGFEVPARQEAELLANLKSEYEMAVRAAFAREEQTRIKAQIREEQIRAKEIDRELKRIDREREAIKAALDKALAEANDQYSAVVENLKARLAEAEEKAQRTISQAQLTKSGHVYVISNIGSFGEGVFKVGMTRRLEPQERIHELSSASVPFPFDVHMMISSDDAPTLEHVLHQHLRRNRINRTNPRKEFFKTDIETICRIVKDNHGEVSFVADAEALQYRQSLTMPEEDQEFVESVYDDLDEETEESVVSDL